MATITVGGKEYDSVYKDADGNYYIPDSRFSGQYVPFKPGTTARSRLNSGSISILDLPSADAVTPPMSYREEVAAGVDVNADRTLGYYGLKPPEDTSTPTRDQGESVSDFTQRINTSISQQDYYLKPGESIDAYNARIAALRGETSGSTSGATGGSGASGGSTGGSYTGTGAVVGTSAAERLKQLQTELGVGTAPKVPDYFTTAMAKELAIARGDRTSINNELASILNERLAIDEEMQKFAINAGEGTTEQGRIGAVSEAQRNVNERLQVLSRRELVLETKLGNRNQVISELMSLQRQEYADASAQYERNFSRALQLYSIFDEEQDELKTNAKANLDVLAQSIQAQIEAGKLNPNNISSSQKRQLQDLEVQAGLPIGSTLAILQTLKPGEEKLYSGVDDYGNFVYISKDAQGQIVVKKAAGAVPQKPSGSNVSSGGLAKDFFTKTQLSKGATASGMSISAFGNLSVDEANKWITGSTPKVTWEEFLSAAAGARYDAQPKGALTFAGKQPEPYAIFTDAEMKELQAMYQKEYGGKTSTTKTTTTSSSGWMTSPY